MNISYLQNKIDDTCIQKVQKNSFNWLDRNCFIQLYNVIIRKIHEIKSSGNSQSNDITKLNNLLNELEAMIHDSEEKLNDIEESGDIARPTDFPPIQFKFLREAFNINIINGGKRKKNSKRSYKKTKKNRKTKKTRK